MAAHDGWNARVELGRRIEAALLEQEAVASDEEIEAALLQEVKRQATVLADLNEMMYAQGCFLMMDSDVMRRELRVATDHARAIVREVLPTMRDASVHMIFTDPPYGHNNNNGDLIHRREAALGRLPCGGDTPLGRPIANDGAEASGLVQHLFSEARRLLKADSCCCCCCCGGGPDPQFARWSLWMDQALAFDQMIVWDKGKMGMGWKYRRSYETVLVGHRKGGKLRWFDTSKRVENVIRPGDYGIKKIIPQKHDHPTPKPVALAHHFIRLHTQRNELVLDPFMGAGSTGLAALAQGRRFVGVELSPVYFDAACKRISEALKAKGRKAAA